MGGIRKRILMTFFVIGPDQISYTLEPEMNRIGSFVFTEMLQPDADEELLFPVNQGGSGLCHPFYRDDKNDILRGIRQK